MCMHMEIRNDTKDKTAVPSLLNYFEKKQCVGA
jgi:hypothetical protein